MSKKTAAAAADESTTSAAQEAYVAELAAAVETIKAKLDGNRDYVRIADDTQGERDMREATGEVITQRERRITCIGKVLAAITDLATDGYPIEPKLRLDNDALFQKFKQNRDSIVAAFDDIEVVSNVAGGAVAFGKSDE